MLRHQWSLLLRRLLIRVVLPVAAFLMLSLMIVHADVPGGKPGPRGAVPNPGTQQQELGNITFPAPYNVFEFVVTCGACHGGTIDQQVGHFGNWAGTNMASSARDPIFRANEIIVEQTVKSITGEEGAGNMCFRCHSPNGWLSGRFDPNFAGASDGSTMMHSILASTDDEGIMCETCHRATGNVTMQREDLPVNDPSWNMMAGLSDWPHVGTPYAEAGNGPLPGNPLGDGTLQFADGMTYGGKYAGSVEIYKSDLPINGTPYTGQTYGVYPSGYSDDLKPKFADNDNNTWPAGQPEENSAGQKIVYNADGSVPIQFEVPIAPPATGLQDQSLSIEHPTFQNDFINSSEFCGTCHDLTVPVLNHGMPEQRTYTEWKYSSFGATDGTGQTCQDCHSPTLKQEYSDDAAVSLNADPTLVGWFPYGKDRNANGGTTVHKLAGANRDLPQMMKILYPEVDLEVIGAPTNNDPRIFPGMMSSRDLTWDRTTRNTEISMTDGVDIEIVSGPTYNNATGKWDVQVKVINQSGHRIPSGYPDGRRFWISLNVTDTTGASVYQSGVYDYANAELKTDSAMPFNRALTNKIDSGNNAVMVYEKVTATCDYSDPAIPFCQPSPSLLNGTIIFDNRIPPVGFDMAKYAEAGTDFWNYDPANFIPYVDNSRYTSGEGYDLVTYSFDAPETAQLSVNANIQWQTHTRPFLEHLKNSDISTLRPEGPPSIYSLNYPLDPTYLSDQVITYYNANNGSAPDVTEFYQIKDMDGNSLRDNWGGIAYAAWMLSGKGMPFIAAADSTADTAAPVAPANWGVKYEPTTGGVTATTVADNPFALDVSWEPAPGAERYIVWIRYGKDISASELGKTASWDTLAVVFPQNGNSGAQTFRSESLNGSKTYQYRIEAINGAGSTFSGYFVAHTITDLPLAPDSLKVITAKPGNVALAWYDLADNEDGFIIERQEVLPNGNLSLFAEVGRTPTVTPGVMGFGANTWTDTSAESDMIYNYQVRAYNAFGISQPSLPVQAKIGPPPGGTINLQFSILNQITAPQVQLTWSGATGTIVGYKIERAAAANGPWTQISTAAGGPTGSFLDTTIAADATYYYRVTAYNSFGDGATTTLQVRVPPVGILPPGVPTGLTWTRPQATLSWTAPADVISGYRIERSNNRNNWTNLVSFDSSGTGTTFTDVSAVAGTRYFYRVVAYNAAGESAPTSVLAVNMPATPPNLELVEATNLSLTVQRSRIRINWTDNSTNESGYYVERREGNGAWTRLDTIVRNNLRTYTDRTVTAGTSYQYRVQSYYTSPDGVTTVSSFSSSPDPVVAR
ncbi:fibronectin type III domain-containing protein [Chloroflexales bacterium ZM16-3]|nr:fibronectin type III domain-containing protein [Chloroflexales bacterium ZM16-3]